MIDLKPLAVKGARLFNLRQTGLLSGLVLGLMMLMHAAFALEPAAVPAGENLSGESCVLREREDLVQSPGLPMDQLIFCGDKAAGQLLYDRIIASGKVDAATAKTLLTNQYARGRAQRLIAAKAHCAEPKWLDDSSTRVLALFPCQLKSGGWPYLVLVSSSKEILSVADGPPALLPVLLKAAGMSAEGIAKATDKAYLQNLWSKPVVLASSADLARFKQMAREGRSASTQGNFAQAEDSLRRALELQIKLLSENDPSIADTLMDIALNVSNQRRDEEAQALFRRAEAIVQKSPFEADRARLVAYQGYEAANRADYEAALKFARAASSAWRKLVSGGTASGVLAGNAANNSAERAELAMALNFEAQMALRNDDVTSAGALASEALLSFSQLDGVPVWWKADVLTTLGEISILQGRLSASETYFNSALAIRKQAFGDGPMTMPVLAALGKAYQREGMNSSAIITYRNVFQLARKFPASSVSLSNEQLVPFGAAVADYAATLTDETAKQGLYAEAFDAFQLSRSSLIDQTIAKAQARLSLTDPQITALVEELQSRQRQMDVARADLSSEQALSDQERSAIIESRLQKEINDQRVAVAQLNQKLATQFPAYNQLSNPKPINLLEMRKRLGDREALVSFIIGKKQSFIQITKRQGNLVAKINAGEEELRESVKTLRRALEIQGTSVNEFNLAASYALYQSLFGAVKNQLQGVDHLIVAAVGPLASLPFGLLVTQTPVAKDYSHAHWLGQQVAISHTPSLQAFFILRTDTPRLIPGKMMLAFADPVLDGKAAAEATTAQPCLRDGPMNSSTLRMLAPLPDTATEVRNIANIMGSASSTLLLREQATETNFMQQPLQDFRILYFATHGLLPGELKCQAEPGLVLTPPRQQAQSKEQDGLLAASEISALKLNADLVVLSACNTAGSGGKFGGEALSGLAESFFFAGARSLVVSHWQVPSAATTKLMSAMFNTLGPGFVGGASLALKAAQARLIADSSTAHPFFWAAFVVVGDGMAQTGAMQLTQNGVAQ